MQVDRRAKRNREMGAGGFEPPKAEPTGLQPVPFGRSGTPPGAAIVARPVPTSARRALALAEPPVDHSLRPGVLATLARRDGDPLTQVRTVHEHVVEELPFLVVQLLLAESLDGGDERITFVIPGELVDARADRLLAPDDHHGEKVQPGTTIRMWSALTSP